MSVTAPGKDADVSATIADLHFEFKGSRTYVHGTDIYNGVADFARKSFGLNELTDINYTLHRIMRTQLRIEARRNERIRRHEATCVELTARAGNDEWQFLLAENGSPVTGRYEYPEDDIVALCDHDPEAKSFSLTAPTPFTDIEVVVAMNKGLVQKLFPDAPGKWFFTKLEMARYERQTPYARLELTLVRNLGLKLTKTRIVRDGHELGHIYFSIV